MVYFTVCSITFIINVLNDNIICKCYFLVEHLIGIVSFLTSNRLVVTMMTFQNGLVFLGEDAVFLFSTKSEIREILLTSNSYNTIRKQSHGSVEDIGKH